MSEHGEELQDREGLRSAISVVRAYLREANREGPARHLIRDGVYDSTDLSKLADALASMAAVFLIELASRSGDTPDAWLDDWQQAIDQPHNGGRAQP